MPQETYYKDHWVEIEPDRLDRYEAQYAWGARGNRLIDGADIRVGHVVADYGCGPGFLSVELARRVGPGGQVLAFDVNADFVARITASVTWVPIKRQRKRCSGGGRTSINSKWGSKWPGIFSGSTSCRDGMARSPRICRQ